MVGSERSGRGFEDQHPKEREGDEKDGRREGECGVEGCEGGEGGREEQGELGHVETHTHQTGGQGHVTY